MTVGVRTSPTYQVHHQLHVPFLQLRYQAIDICQGPILGINILVVGLHQKCQTFSATVYQRTLMILMDGTYNVVSHIDLRAFEDLCSINTKIGGQEVFAVILLGLTHSTSTPRF